jgi:ABC-2 type transport system ATP-binding protein
MAAPNLPAGTYRAPETGPLPGAGPTTMIELRGVSKSFDDETVVHDLTFEVMQGEIFGFIGPSGSGKTTTIRLITGVYHPTEGTVRLMGADPTHTSRQVQERFGYMPQHFVLYPTLTVRENLYFSAALYGMGLVQRRRRVDELLKFVELWDARNKVAVNISGGMQRRVQLAASLLHNPPLLFTDEPTAGIDPVLRGKFWEEFRRLRDEGRTIFVTTQYVGESEYCDRVGVIRAGRVIALDTPVNLRRTAMGGDVVDIESDAFNPGAIFSLSQLPFVEHVRPVSRREVRVHVQEAGAALPLLMDAMNDNECPVQRIEEYRPSFDEVFIELMKRDEASNPTPEGAQNE